MKSALVTMLAFAGLAVGPARQADAQSSAPAERFRIGVNGGVQAASSAARDTFRFPLYTEEARVDVSYPSRSGALFEADAAYRIWRRMTIGAAFTRHDRGARAGVTAQLPHPFFDERFREIAGDVDAPRVETGAHVMVGWLIPLRDRLRLLVAAGPSVIGVRQALVTEVRFAEAFPFDTTEFTGGVTERASRTATGFNAGADVSWLFSRRIGAGVMLQYTRARARLDAGGGRTVALDAGGLHAAAGLRFVFGR